ncbi:MarR family winged helix-turn-helix transcriptional regulator [Kineococcus sp. LSe6-4]|uniref:MarR family winged helix-turn-helix transcriptional regulator n=1 Tax=Kineococcus halophytocola TaxID=3234027 RepID=A0ABV4GWQ3_9ACTN
MTSPTSTAPLARRLGPLLGPLRRAVLRRSRDLAGLPDLPEAQVELLRALAETGPHSPSGLADRLRLARPTVSNLLRAMTATGLVVRTPGAGRAVAVTPTDHARTLLRRYDAASSRTLERALARLDPADRAALVTALPALERLLAALGDD